MLSTKSKRRRRRGGSSAHRYPAASLVQDTRPRYSIGAMEIAGAVVSCLIGATLIVLVWMVTSRSIQEQRDQTRDTVLRNLSGQANIMAKSIGHELLLIDQSLLVLQQAWQADSGTFDINRWKAQMPALLDVADDLFIADDQRIIRQDILPQAIGQGIATGYVSWPHGTLERLGELAPRIGGAPLGSQESPVGTETRRFTMYIIRPLLRPAGWLIGASYRTDQMIKQFSQGWFGPNALAGIVDLQNGGLQTVVGAAARRPQRSLGRTELYALMQKNPSGVWIGESPVDKVQRLFAFTRVPGRDMSVVVSASETDAMGPAESFASAARSVAVAASLTVVAASLVIAWTFYRYRANRRREATRKREVSELTRLRQDESRLAERAQLQGARLRELIEHTSDGVALVDSELRVTRWNRRFEQGIGVPLEENMPVDALLRQQAAIGLIEPEGELDVEAEITRRVLALRSGQDALPQLAVGGQDRFLRGLPIAEGGLILLLTGVGNLPLPPLPVPEVAGATGSAAATVEW